MGDIGAAVIGLTPSMIFQETGPPSRGVPCRATFRAPQGQTSRGREVQRKGGRRAPSAVSRHRSCHMRSPLTEAKPGVA